MKKGSQKIIQSLFIVSALAVVLSMGAVSITAAQEAGSVRSIDINGVERLRVGDVNLRQVSQPDIEITVEPAPLPPEGSAGQESTASSTDAIDAGVEFLKLNQNADGSWETASGTAFFDTAAAIEVFETLGTTSDQTYLDAIDWLGFEFPQNTDFLAEKVRARAVAATGDDFGVEYMVFSNNLVDGGFGFQKEYQSDAVTTAKVLGAVTASGYTDAGADPDFTLLSILAYFITSQQADGGWPEAPGGASSVFATSHALESLEPYQSLIISGLPGGDAAMADVTASALSWLSNIQQADGTWNGDILDTALALRQLTRYAADVVYKDEALDYLLSSQEADGSWQAGNFYATSKALQALVDADLSRPDLAIADVVATTPLENGSLSEFHITAFNEGGQTVTDGVLNLFVDDFLYASWNLADLGFVVAPGATQNIFVVFGNSLAFVGNTEMRWYIETSNEQDYADNWHSDTFTFAENSRGEPAVQVYFAAYAEVTGAGAPTIHYQWALKQDSNRLYHAVWWRELGAPDWFIAIADTNATGAILPDGWVAEGKTYEVGVTTMFPDGSTVWLPFGTNTVQVSSDLDLYAGDLEGEATVNNESLGGVSIRGFDIPDAVTTASGTFAFTGIPNGANAFWVQDPLYEKNITKAAIPVGATASGTRVFTRLKHDTEPPSITLFEVQGEPDLSFDNNQTVTLFAEGTDNETIKEADFVLVKPDGSRSYLGTAPFTPAGATSAVFDWFVPTSLTGTGFMLEAVLQDYQDNVSAPAGYGPFEITPGSVAPSITVLEPDGIGDTADETFTITWQDADEDDNASLSLYYDTDSTGQDGTLIVEGISEDSPLDQYTWATLAVPDGDYYVYAVITDGIASSTDYSDGFLTLLHINDPPVAVDDTSSTDEDTPVTIDVLANDTDTEDDPLSVVSLTQPANGTSTLNADNTVTYTPNSDFNGIDSFTYKAYDGAASSTPATVDITVNPVNDPPTITVLEPDGLADAADASFLITWADSDPDDDALISLYGDRDDTGQDGVLIAEGISEDSPEDSFLADTSAVPNGAYFIYATITDGVASSTSYSAGPLTVFHRTQTIYEDAEDGATLGWSIFDNDPPGASIANVLDSTQGRVIETSGSSTLNAFALGKEDDTPFANTTEFTASWDMKVQESANFAWRVEVNDSKEGMLLYGDAFAPGCSLAGTTLRCGLDPALYDGLWHTVTRDLEADIASVFPGAALTQVNNFGIQGSARVDNVALATTF